jgi:hypothetical protein
VSLLLITVASLYLAATFRGHTFPTPLPENLDVNQSGTCVIKSVHVHVWLYMASQSLAYTQRSSRLSSTLSGLSSIFSLPISLVTSAVYTEALWQRVRGPC